MKKKILLIVAILIVIALCIGLIVPMMSKGNTGNKTNNNPKTSSSEDAGSSVLESAETPKEDTTASADDTKTGQKSENSKGDNVSDADSSSGGGDVSSAKKSPADASKKTNNKSSKSKTQKQTSSESTDDISEISFPYAVSGTDLVVEKIRSYDGYFVEDGLDKKVSGVAAIVLKNNGDNLEFAGIGISQGTRSLGFSASQIPAGATVIVQEQNGAEYSSSDPYYSATATTRSAKKFEMSEKLVSVKDNGDNGLTVSNISDKTLSEVKIFFKNYLKDEDAYVGGITYTITMNDLKSGESMDVSASHYDSKYSKVLEVRAK